MECGGKFMKVFLIIMNILFLIIGVVALGMGIWALVDGGSLSILNDIWTSDVADVPYLIKTGAIILVVVGVFTCIVALLGCVGAAKESRCVLIVYAICLVVVLVLQVAAIVVAAVFQDKFKSTLTSAIKDKLVTNYDGDVPQTDSYNIAFDKIQQKFKCCGILSYTDLNASISTVIPKMCCKLSQNNYPDSVTTSTANCENLAANPTKDYTNQGCYDAIKDEISSKALPIYVVGAFVLLLELLGILFACCMCCMIAKEDAVV